MKNRKTIYSILLSIVFFCLGAVIGWFIHKQPNTTGTTLTREDSPDYKFIKPILLLHVPEDDTTPEFQSLKKVVSTYINTAIHAGNATDVSMYFRNLNTNEWTGINADDTYSPASMLKVVSLISFLRASESDPNLLNENVSIDVPSTDNQDTNQDYYPAPDQVKLGSTYTTEQLLSYMIDDSDNNAAGTINSLIGQETLNQTFADFKIPSTNENVSSDFVSVKMYSRLWRALYDGTYISQPLSEQALDLLSKTTFTEGLVAGVPAGTTVAHKFGERTIDATNTTSEVHELHDCGIVYPPNKDPYFICVMTKGNSFTSLQKIISDISSIVWKQTGQ